MRLLLVEDDEILGDGIVAGLKEVLYSIDWIKDGGQLESALLYAEYDAIILDLSSSRGSGLDLTLSVIHPPRSG